MKDWQAAIAAYLILQIAAETEVAPIAVVLAWAIALEQLYEVFKNPNHQILAELFGSRGASSGGTPPQIQPSNPLVNQ